MRLVAAKPVNFRENRTPRLFPCRKLVPFIGELVSAGGQKEDGKPDPMLPKINVALPACDMQSAACFVATPKFTTA
jgi:hypothetical protein